MERRGLTLDIMICTIGDGIFRVSDMLLPERSDIRYTVSIQNPDNICQTDIPARLSARPDVNVSFMDGTGLSRNRNNALSMATGDICLIADDDNRYLPEYIDNILDAWSGNPDADIITFQAQTYEGAPLHPYPAPYVCSVEITFRRSSIISKDLKFDERFGLGSPLLCAGEEDVFMADAQRAGLNIKYIPKVIVQTKGITTSTGFIGNKKLQITKGATFRHVYGVCGAVWRSFKEAGWYLIHKGANPLPILFNMIKGIWILQ